MSKNITNAVKYGNKLKDAVTENKITSLLITATTVMAEFAEKYFLYFFAFTIGYILFDRVVRLKEMPHIRDIDVNDMKKDVIDKQEFVRAQVLLSRINMIDRESKLNTAVTLKLIKDAGTFDEVGEAMKEYADKYNLHGQKLDNILKDIDIPYENFLKQEKEVPAVSTYKIAEQKFSDINILQEGKK